MTERLKVLGRVALLVLCAVVAVAAFAAVAPSHGLAQQNSNQKPAQPKKKKLPPGARGFENYANRDASDKLATGGATRDPCETDTAEKAVKCGMKLYSEEKYTDAASAFKQATALAPSMFRAHYYLGIAHEAAGQYAPAIAAYGRAAALKLDESVDDPLDHFRAQNNMANSYALMGKHAEAAAAYRRLIEVLPSEHSATAHYNLGLSLSAMNKQAEAVEEFKHAVEIKPDYADAHYNLGLAYARLEDYAPAVESFKRALELQPDYPKARYNLGLAYYLTEDRAGLAEQHKSLSEAKSPLAAELAKLLGK